MAKKHWPKLHRAGTEPAWVRALEAESERRGHWYSWTDKHNRLHGIGPREVRRWLRRLVG